MIVGPSLVGVASQPSDVPSAAGRKRWPRVARQHDHQISDRPEGALARMSGPPPYVLHTIERTRSGEKATRLKRGLQWRRDDPNGRTGEITYHRLRRQRILDDALSQPITSAGRRFRCRTSSTFGSGHSISMERTAIRVSPGQSHSAGQRHGGRSGCGRLTIADGERRRLGGPTFRRQGTVFALRRDRDLPRTH